MRYDNRLVVWNVIEGNHAVHREEGFGKHPSKRCSDLNFEKVSLCVQIPSTRVSSSSGKKKKGLFPVFSQNSELEF